MTCQDRGTEKANRMLPGSVIRAKHIAYFTNTTYLRKNKRRTYFSTHSTETSFTPFFCALSHVLWYPSLNTT